MPPLPPFGGLSGLQDLPPGLSDDEARARLARDGPNRLVRASQRPLLRIALDVLRQPMILLLAATALAYVLLGSVADSAGLLVSVVFVASISIYQQRRTERVLESLRDLASPRSRVVRGGQVQRVPSHELVRDDVIVVGEGDRLACDATLLRAESLLVDESMLTGESAPVLKDAAAEPKLFAGTLVVQGRGLATVSATGARTALGRIGTTMQAIAPRQSAVQAELEQVVRRVAWWAAITSLVAAAAYVAQRGSWAEGLLAGLTLAMSLIPEEFAVVWAVMMALGAWRLARVRVLTRQPQAIETLGTIGVLAVDKTGTLTLNRMTLRVLATGDAEAEIGPDGRVPAPLAPLLAAALRAASDDGIEPMDRAIRQLRERESAAAPPGWTLLRRDGVAAGRPYVVHWWHDDTGQGRLAVKGAPEAVLAACTMDGAAASEAQRRAAALADRGLRVLAVAEGAWDASGPVPDTLPPLLWLGLLGFIDPLRDDVPQAIAECRAAGIRVVMITGDGPLTARAIARAAGLVDDHEADVLNGAEIDALDDAALRDRLGGVSVCARISPEQKLRIVRALQARGDVVAMTGDGVNDAPALRAADIGVAMGERGTDVAREAASLVLQDDSFGSLVAGVRQGRRIFVNLQKSVGYLLAVHLPIVAVAVLPLLIGGPQLLLPLHVVFLELLIDPACSLVFEAEPEPADAMRVPPRRAGVRLISAPMVRRALLVGGAGIVAVVALQALARAAGWSDDMCRAVALGSVIATNLAMLVWFRRGDASLHVARGKAANPAFVWLLVALTVACGVVLAATPLTRQFGLPIGPAVQGAGAVLVVAGMLAALLVRWRPGRNR